MAATRARQNTKWLPWGCCITQNDCHIYKRQDPQMLCSVLASNEMLVCLRRHVPCRRGWASVNRNGAGRANSLSCTVEFWGDIFWELSWVAQKVLVRRVANSQFKGLHGTWLFFRWKQTLDSASTIGWLCQTGLSCQAKCVNLPSFHDDAQCLFHLGLYYF